MRSKILSRLKPLARDLFILVTGIMLSLILNECRQNVRAGQDEERIMRQLQQDIAADTSALVEMIEELDVLLSLYEPLYSNDSLEHDLRYGIASSVAYVPFRPNRTAILELSYSNRSGDIERRDLVARATALHESGYNVLSEIGALIAEYVTREHLPFVTDNLIYIPGSNYNDEQLEELDAFINSSAFRQRTNWLEILWANHQMAAENALKESRELLYDLNDVYGSK